MAVVFKTRDGKTYSPADAPTDTLRWYAENAKSESHRDAAIAELERRPIDDDDLPPSERPPSRETSHHSGGVRAGHERVTALATVQREDLAFSLADPNAINERLRAMTSQVVLLTPTQLIASIPDGHEIESTYVLTNEDDFWSIEGRPFLKGHKVTEIAVALNVSWNHEHTHRVGDRSIQNLWEFQAVGQVQNFDGSLRTIVGHYELDLRDGSAALQKLKPGQITQKRTCGLQLAETGAKFRAIVSGCALKRSVAREDIGKPFVALKLRCTGNYQDPELRREYSRLLAQRALGVSMPALYPPTQPQALPPGRTLDVEPDPFGPDGEPAQ